MKSITRLIVGILSLQIAFGSAPVRSAVAAETEVSKPAVAYRVALLTLRDLVKENPENFVDPSDREPDSAFADKVSMMEANQALLAKVNDTSYTLAEIRGDLIKRLNEEEAAQVIEIRNLLLKMDDRDVEKITTDSFAKGHYSDELKMRYDTAYFLNEKKEVVFDLLRADLSDAKSDALKRLGLMDRKLLAKEISGTSNLLNTKGDGWKVALIIVLSVIAAGLISYGVVSAVKSRHERKLRELDAEYKKKNQDLETSDKNRTAEEIAADKKATEDALNQHGQDMQNTNTAWQNKTDALNKLYSDRAALREAGYTWQVCKTTTQATTVTCPYDHKTYVGNQVCAQYCLKDTKGNTLPVSDLICSSKEIPWSCYTPSAVDTGTAKGRTDGYNDGYDYGYSVEYTKAYNQAYQDYYKIAYDSGYSRGYQYGFDDGYNDGISDGKYKGYNDGKVDGYSHGDEDGYPLGYSVGYTYGQQVAAGG